MTWLHRLLQCALGACIFLGVLRAPAFAEAEPSWTLQTDPLTDALGIVNLLLERRVSSHIAVYLGPSLKLYDSVFEDVDAEDSYRAYGIELGARWFFSGTAPTRWWAGVRATIAQVTHEDSSDIGGYVSGLGGYAWAFDDRWVLSLALGLSYFDYTSDGAGVDGILPGAHTGVGVAF